MKSKIITLSLLIGIAASVLIVVARSTLPPSGDTGLTKFTLSRDYQTMADIQLLLYKHRFTEEYSRDVFDCSDMSYNTWYILKRYGYDAKIVDDGEKHLFVAVVLNDGIVPIESTGAGIGKVIFEPSDYYSRGIIYDSPEAFEAAFGDESADVIYSDKLYTSLPIRRTADYVWSQISFGRGHIVI